MKILTIIILLTITTCYGQNIIISKDTTINGVWLLPQGKVIDFQGGKVKGNCIIKGGIVKAAYRSWIFDTTVTVQCEGTYDGIYSACWNGASASVLDNSRYLQLGINTALALSSIISEFRIPKGVYNYTQPLKICNLYKGFYAGCTIHISGEGAFWDSGNGTTLKYNSPIGFALGGQQMKGCEIEQLKIIGMFVSPLLPSMQYYSLTEKSFIDPKCNLWYYGLVIDYENNSGSISGSTGCKIHDMNVTNFTVNYAISPTGTTLNAEILIFENCRVGDGLYGFQTSEAQEKGNIIRGLYSWGKLFCLFSSGKAGKYQAGNYYIDGVNVAGSVIKFCDIDNSGWYTTTIKNVYAESIGSIGEIKSVYLPVSIENCTFHFAFIEDVGQLVLFKSNNLHIKLSNVIMRYFGKKSPMVFDGLAYYDNCTLSGSVINNTLGSIYYNCEIANQIKTSVKL